MFKENEKWRTAVNRVLKMEGVPVDPLLASRISRCYQCDLADVRLHLGTAATEAASLLNAAAFAVGRHIVFGEGQFRPDTEEGLWLIAHELAHVAQNQVEPTSCELRIAPAESPCEIEANACANAVVNGSALMPPEPRDSHAAWIYRHPGDKCPPPGKWVEVNAGVRWVYEAANQTIEEAYTNDKDHSGHRDAILVGSSWLGVPSVMSPRGTSTRVSLPAGAPNRALGNAILDRLIKISGPARPDIIDFHKRRIYEIKTAGNATKGIKQLHEYPSAAPPQITTC